LLLNYRHTQGSSDLHKQTAKVKNTNHIWDPSKDKYLQRAKSENALLAIMPPPPADLNPLISIEAEQGTTFVTQIGSTRGFIIQSKQQSRLQTIQNEIKMPSLPNALGSLESSIRRTNLVSLDNTMV